MSYFTRLVAYGQTDAGLPSTITPGTTTTTILPSSLLIHTGNSVTGTTLNQVLLQGTTTNNAHAIKTRHNAAGDLGQRDRPLRMAVRDGRSDDGGQQAGSDDLSDGRGNQPAVPHIGSTGERDHHSDRQHLSWRWVDRGWHNFSIPIDDSLATNGGPIYCR